MLSEVKQSILKQDKTLKFRSTNKRQNRNEQAKNVCNLRLGLFLNHFHQISNQAVCSL